MLVCTGEWTVLSLGRLEKKLTALRRRGESVGSISIAGIQHLDTAGALVLHRLRSSLSAQGKLPAVISENRDYLNLLEQVAANSGDGIPAAPRRPGPVIDFLNTLGKTIVTHVREGKDLLGFFGHFLVTCANLPRKPRSVRLTALIYHMEQTGLAAVPIVALLSFLIGLVIAYMGAQLLVQFGANIYVVNLVEISILRELGVLMTSIVVAGRSGSSFTAEIGAMQANEEVDAMRSMGLDPMTLLVMPRVAALFIMLPALVFLSDVMAIFGGSVASMSSMDLNFSAFALRFQQTANLNNLFVGMIKAPFFAVIIGVVGCFKGFQATGSADSVGRLTTESVVESIFLVIVLDALFAIFFMQLGV
ncbi:ABC transporter permease [Desulfovibrio sp. OttesenSCG-928-I05]|nr:ABC transporter permease [Desulfovibrio sp. OttesenSCG-928-I05]